LANTPPIADSTPSAASMGATVPEPPHIGRIASRFRGARLCAIPDKYLEADVDATLPIVDSFRVGGKFRDQGRAGPVNLNCLLY
jgi:hypothetical protein